MTGKFGTPSRPPYVPIPNVVIDDVLPTLRDTEFRVLLVVLRQTLGWTSSKGEVKERDWLSSTQLQARTGRSSEAVSSAISVLLKRGLIHVTGEAGNPLSTSAERRRLRGRLYFSPGPVILMLDTPKRSYPRNTENRN